MLLSVIDCYQETTLLDTYIDTYKETNYYPPPTSLHRMVREMGCALDEPFMVLPFLALPGIPELKIIDRGLVDVTQFKIIPLSGDA